MVESQQQWNREIISQYTHISFLLFLDRPGRQLSQHLTWTGCTRPSTLHVWRVILLSPSSLSKQLWDLHSIPQKTVYYFHRMNTPQPVWFVLQLDDLDLQYGVNITNPHVMTCEHVMFQVYIIEYYLFSDFRNSDNVLTAKIISNLPDLFEAMNVDAVLVSWCI